MLEYRIKVKGYAAERETFRDEVVTTRVYGTQTETVKSDEYTDEDLTNVKEKVDTSKNKKPVTAFPEDEEQIVEIIRDQAPLRLAGMFKEIAGTIRGDTKNWKPPKGRYGITNQLQYWTVDLDDVELANVKRSQFLQIHGNFNAKGSTLEYGDSADFTATMRVWTPALDYDDAEPVIRKILDLSRLTKFGPFRSATLTFVN